MDMAQKAPDALSKGSQILGNSLARTGGGIQGALNSVKDQGLMNAAKGGVSNMVDLAEWKAFEAMQNTKGAVGNVLDKLDDKAASAQNATYNALKNDAVAGINQHGPVDIPEPPVDPVTTEAPVVDPTPSAEGEEPPIQDSTPPADAPVSESTPPAQPDSSQQKFQQSMNQMNYMNQQMQQAGQRMQGGRHITGAESEDEEE